MSNATHDVMGTVGTAGTVAAVETAGAPVRGSVARRDAAHAVLRAFRMDWRKVTSQGWQWIPILMIGLPVLMLAVALVGGDSFVGGLYGSFFYVYIIVIPVYAFMYEERDHGLWLNGIMPVGRVHQVVARYLLVFVSAMSLLASYLAAWAMLRVAGLVGVAAAGDSSGATWMSTFAFLWLYLIIQSVMCPMLYRFGTQKAIVWVAAFGMTMFAGAIGGFAAAAEMVPSGAIGALPGEALAVLASAVAEPRILILLGVVTAVLALAVSFRISVRCYRAKEL